jgi:glycosyltransferase involved in cell wall biosynthesis
MPRPKALFLLPFQILWWTATLQLGHRLQARRDYRLVAQSGIFDPEFYVSQGGVQAGIDPLLDYLIRGGFEGHDPHPLFDSDWYLRQNPDVRAAGINPLLHYAQEGWRQGRNPHPFFDVAFYLELNADVKQAGIDPLRHYLVRGAAEERDPHPLFDSTWYLHQNPAAAGSGTTPLAHYVLHGAAELRPPHPLFDPQFYLAKHPEARASGMDPLLYYLTVGARRHHSPHPLFDVDFYLKQNPVLETSGLDPLQHYIRKGAREGLDPCELFYSSFYLDQYTRVAQKKLNPLAHYWTEGVAEHCNPNPLFDTKLYLKQYPDIAAAGVNPLLDFIASGALEGRFPNPFFDPRVYLKKNPDVKRAGANPLAHYLRRGAAEGRDPGPFFSTKRYVSEHPELGGTGINPLAHFLRALADRAAPSRPLDRTIRLLLLPDDPEEIPPSETCLNAPTSTSVAAANEVLRKASEAEHHLLVLFGAAFPGKEVVRLLLEAFKIDPHFGMATPRQSDPATGDVLQLSHHFGDPEIAALPKAILSEIPQYYIIPETLTSCFLLRNSVVSNFDLLDQSHETLAGAFQQYLCRIRRCGFRSVVVNNALVPRTPAEGPWLVTVEGADLLRVHREYPDVARAKLELADGALHRHESLLGRALSRDKHVRKSLLLDVTGLPNHVDGTAEAIIGVCDGVKQLDSNWAITLLTAPVAAEFHKLSQRYPDWEIIGEEDDRYFTAGLRPSQPWDLDSMIRLHRSALFNFYAMLDTIAWDILLVAPAGLDATWNFLSAYADGLVYISQYTRDRFATRFPLSRDTSGYVSHLSFNPSDYKVEVENGIFPSREEFIFVIGNAYDHKNVGPTVDMLAAAFPSQRIKALGLKSHRSDHVDCLESGRIDQTDVDRLFATAMAIVFPSFYEGFGFPVLKGLSNGRTVIARNSQLLLEIADRYRGPGRLISFRNPLELLEAVQRVRQHSEVVALPLGSALHDAEKPRGWKEVAGGILQFIEEQTQEVSRSRWSVRQRLIEQFEAYSG